VGKTLASRKKSADSRLPTRCKNKLNKMVLFQMIVSTSRPLKANGLPSIWVGIPANLKQTPPILVFVVPVDVARTLSRQTIEPSVSNTSVRNSPNLDKWDQYVLEVNDERLWKILCLIMQRAVIPDFTASWVDIWMERIRGFCWVLECWPVVAEQQMVGMTGMIELLYNC